MRNWLCCTLLAFALPAVAGLQVQNLDQSFDAFQRGDYQAALVGFRAFAAEGKVEAQNGLGVMYEQGLGVPQDFQQAMRWYRKAADQGMAVAQSNLGAMLAHGRGVAQDDSQAVKWFRRAAQQGYASAQQSLGAMYASGRGGTKDFNQAAHWFRKAAEQGTADAQKSLGVMYVDGKGVPKDEQMAYFWWLLASAQGNQNATVLRDDVERHLSSDQRSAAQAAARNWKPKTSEQTNDLSDSGEEKGTTPAPSRVSPSSSQADATGSGFRVARGAVVTNHHVIDGCSRLRVNGVTAQVRGSDARSDLALLNTSALGLSISLRAQRVAVGEQVAVAGYPLRGLLSGFNMTIGNLSSLSGMGGDTRLLQITAPVQPGNSGGPVLDSSGNLMGVVVSKLDAIKAAKLTGDIPQNVNFAINANVLRSFLDANSVEYETASSDKSLLNTAIAEKARSFTVLVECWK